MSKTLLIYVPSYEAKERLGFFLERFQEELIGCENDVDLHINDNASDYDIHKEFHHNSNIKITINRHNEGLARNLNKVFKYNSQYLYTWVIGDDDYLMPGSLRRLIELLKSYAPDFVFLNTKTWSKLKRTEVLSFFNKQKRLPHKGGHIKSNLRQDLFFTEFSKLIDPKIDGMLLGSLMCGLFKTELVRDCSSDKFPEGNELSVWSSYPHVINYAKSLSPDASAIYDPFIYTFNFWDGGNTWKNELDIAVALGVLYSIKCYSENKHLNIDAEKNLLKHYMAISGESRYKLFIQEKKSLGDQYNEVYPYLLAHYEPFDGSIYSNFRRCIGKILRTPWTTIKYLF
jgi:hypothetical protein